MTLKQINMVRFAMIRLMSKTGFKRLDVEVQSKRIIQGIAHTSWIHFFYSHCSGVV